MKYIGQKFTYTKYVDITSPTTKKIKVTDAEGNKYTITRSVPAKYINVPCIVRDLITTTSVANAKTEIAFIVDITVPNGNTTEIKTITIHEKSPMWDVMEEAVNEANYVG